MPEYNPEKTELRLYLENTGSLEPQRQSIVKNLKAKIVKGKYDPEQAVKAWQYWVDAGARAYCKENRCELARTFPATLRREIAKEVSIAEKGEMDIELQSRVTLELSPIKLNRQGYTSSGQYYGVGQKLFNVSNPDTGHSFDFRAADLKAAKRIVELIGSDRKNKLVADRFSKWDLDRLLGTI